MLIGSIDPAFQEVIGLLIALEEGEFRPDFDPC